MLERAVDRRLGSLATRSREVSFVTGLWGADPVSLGLGALRWRCTGTELLDPGPDVADDAAGTFLCAPAAFETEAPTLRLVLVAGAGTSPDVLVCARPEAGESLVLELDSLEGWLRLSTAVFPSLLALS